MATKRQIAANRRNARRSTGPRSAAGKAASSANALRHGLAAARAVVLPDEDADAYERLRQGVIADLDPAGALQEALAQRIVVLLWRLDRAARLEAELFIHGRLAVQRKEVAASAVRESAAAGLTALLGEADGRAGGALPGQARHRRGHPRAGALGAGPGGTAGERKDLRPPGAPRGDAAAGAQPDAGGFPGPAPGGGGGSGGDGARSGHGATRRRRPGRAPWSGGPRRRRRLNCKTNRISRNLFISHHKLTIRDERGRLGGCAQPPGGM